VINPGAGIPASYYAKFAEWLASLGVPVLTYDYRGVARSRPRSLRGFRASVEDWGSKDCAAALQFMRVRYPGANIAIVGHSIGCFLTGFVNRPELIDTMVFIGPHTGYYKDYAPYRQLIMRMAWHVVMPKLTKLVGYFPGRALGLPADLPRGVALEWAQRTQPDFWWNLRDERGRPDTSRMDRLRRGFASIACRGLMIQIADDDFATADGIARVASLFRGVDFERRMVRPFAASNQSVEPIGHFGFFRSKYRESLWPHVSRWIVKSQQGG